MGSHVAVVKFLHISFGKEVSNRMIMFLNGMRKKRHRVVYEEMDIVSKSEAERALGWTIEFVNGVDAIVRKHVG